MSGIGSEFSLMRRASEAVNRDFRPYIEYGYPHFNALLQFALK